MIDNIESINVATTKREIDVNFSFNPNFWVLVLIFEFTIIPTSTTPLDKSIKQRTDNPINRINIDTNNEYKNK